MVQSIKKMLFVIVMIAISLPIFGENRIINTYRERTAIGFKDVAIYSDGSRIEAHYKPCTSCFGSGRCSLCGGQGGIISAGYGTYIPCAGCGQTGRCVLCAQTGGYVLYDSQLYDSVGNRVYIGSVGGSSNYGGYSSGSSRGSSNSSSTCSKCHGTGVSPVPNSGGSLASWVAHYNSAGSDCPYCNRFDEHYHDRCARCNVP